MTVAPAGACYSILPEYKPSTGCAQNIPSDAITSFSTVIDWYGSSTSLWLLEPVSVTGSYATFETTLDTPTDWVGVSGIPMITLLHKAEEATVTVSGNGAVTSSPSAGSSRAGLSRSGILVAMVLLLILIWP